MNLKMRYLNKKLWKESLISMSGSLNLLQISLMFLRPCLQPLEENILQDNWFEAGRPPLYTMGRLRGAESRRDFIHKIKIGLKELRETFNCLRIIKKKGWYQKELLAVLIDENNQLISIFVKSNETARKNLDKERNEP